jgi:hypothetical protein
LRDAVEGRLRQETTEGYDPAVVAMVRFTTTTQGLPEKIEDPDTLRRIVQLLRPPTRFRLPGGSDRTETRATSERRRDQPA